MDPNNPYQQPPYQPAQPAPPQNVGPVTTPPMSNGLDNQPSESDSGRKKMLLLIGAGVAVLLVIIVAVVLLAGGKDEPAPVDEPASKSAELLRPASVDSLQQIDSAISQDLSTIDDAKDFPADQLSDDSLDL